MKWAPGDLTSAKTYASTVSYPTDATNRLLLRATHLLLDLSFGLYFHAAPDEYPAMASVLEFGERDSHAIQDLCRQIADGMQAAGACPRCAVDLQAAITLQAVEVRCPSGCFCFSYRRDPLTGAFVSGVLDFPSQSGAMQSKHLASPVVDQRTSPPL
jgi:hypothetical protein